ncbi:MAG: hypothetical protein QUS08_08000 [Methanothrix sp.]|nr:hypothetical protein [Methanothrix sp.]
MRGGGLIWPHAVWPSCLRQAPGISRSGRSSRTAGSSRQRGGYAFEVSLSASDEGVMAARIRAILEMLDAQFCPGEAS